MRHAFEPPRLGILVAEYLVWSVAVAAVPAIFLTLGVLNGDPEDIYDEQAEIVRALAGGVVGGLLFANLPLALMVLWRLAVPGGRALSSVWSWLRLYVEYAAMVFLTPMILATIGLGDPQHAYNPGDPYAMLVRAFAIAPGALITMRALLVFLILGLLRTGRIAQNWMSGCSVRSARGRVR